MPSEQRDMVMSASQLVKNPVSISTSETSNGHSLTNQDQIESNRVLDKIILDLVSSHHLPIHNSRASNLNE